MDFETRAALSYHSGMNELGVVNNQGFQPVFDPTPATLGVVTGTDATFFIF